MRHESNSRPLPRGHARPDGSNSTRGTGDGDSDAGSGAGAGAAGAGAGSSGALVPRDADDDVSVPLPAWPLPPVATPSVDHPPLSGFADTQAFMSYVTQLHTTVLSNLSHVGELLELKDVHFNRIKSDLVAQMVARRRQDRKIASSQVVLKFMFDTNARLRGELRHERESTRCERSLYAGYVIQPVPVAHPTLVCAIVDRGASAGGHRSQSHAAPTRTRLLASAAARMGCRRLRTAGSTDTALELAQALVPTVLSRRRASGRPSLCSA